MDDNKIFEFGKNLAISFGEKKFFNETILGSVLAGGDSFISHENYLLEKNDLILRYHFEEGNDHPCLDETEVLQIFDNSPPNRYLTEVYSMMKGGFVGKHPGPKIHKKENWIERLKNMEKKN